MTIAMETLIWTQLEALSTITGYDVNFLYERYNECEGDMGFVIGVSMERDW